MVWSWGLYNTLELLMMGIMVRETCWASKKICNKNHLLHLVGILFPHINDDARSKPYQIAKTLLLLKNWANKTATYNVQCNKQVGGYKWKSTYKKSAGYTHLVQRDELSTPYISIRKLRISLVENF